MWGVWMDALMGEKWVDGMVDLKVVRLVAWKGVMMGILWVEHWVGRLVDVKGGMMELLMELLTVAS